MCICLRILLAVRTRTPEPVINKVLTMKERQMLEDGISRENFLFHPNKLDPVA